MGVAIAIHINTWQRHGAATGEALRLNVVMEANGEGFACWC
ncbi:hypothetical protein ACFWQD_03470 [Alcaligenes faecalis]